MARESSPADENRPAPAVAPAGWSPKRKRFVRRVAVTTAACVAFLWLVPLGVVWIDSSFRGDPPGFGEIPPAVGEPAPDFALKDVEGVTYRLAERVGRVPVVIEFGSFS